ncbi:MAG: trigger factor [Synechococcales bacterium]|nr:trigger factor [Synechococcales bacterium]
MKVTQEKLPASQVGLEIEITPEMSKQAYEKALREFTRNANIPGFRKGKVPRQILIQRLGSARIKAAVIEELVEDSLKKAIEQEEINAIGNFRLQSSFEELVEQFQPGVALTFSATVDVPPDVNLGEYRGLTVQAEEAVYDPEQVESLLANYQQRTATLVPVEDRAAQTNDVAIVDFDGYLVPTEGSDEEPTPIPGGSTSDFQIELGPGRFIDGFVDGIVGMEPGQTREISATFPENYPQDDLAGRQATFTVTLKELKEKELPELDDEFAQEISEFETMAALRESLEKRFKDQAIAKTKQNKHSALLDELVKHVEVDLPETLIKQEVDHLVAQTIMRLESQGLDAKQFLTPELLQGLKERSRDEAIARIKRTLALGEVAKRESITVDADELESTVDDFMAEYDDRDLDEERVRRALADDLLEEKVLDWLEEQGTVELVPEGTLTKPEADEAETETVEEAGDSLPEAVTENISPENAVAEAAGQTVEVAATTVPEVAVEDPAAEAAAADNQETDNQET